MIEMLRECTGSRRSWRCSTSTCAPSSASRGSGKTSPKSPSRRGSTEPTPGHGAGRHPFLPHCLRLDGLTPYAGRHRAGEAVLGWKLLRAGKTRPRQTPALPGSFDQAIEVSPPKLFRRMMVYVRVPRLDRARLRRTLPWRATAISQTGLKPISGDCGRSPSREPPVAMVTTDITDAGAIAGWRAESCKTLQTESNTDPCCCATAQDKPVRRDSTTLIGHQLYRRSVPSRNGALYLLGPAVRPIHVEAGASPRRDRWGSGQSGSTLASVVHSSRGSRLARWMRSR